MLSLIFLLVKSLVERGHTHSLSSYYDTSKLNTRDTVKVRREFFHNDAKLRFCGNSENSIFLFQGNDYQIGPQFKIDFEMHAF